MPVIAICIPSHSDPKYQHVTAMQTLQVPKPAHLFRTYGLDIETARQELTKKALAVPEVTHLLFVDDDMVPPPDALTRLLAHDLPIVGALCHNRRAPSYQPILARDYPPELGFIPGAKGFCYVHPDYGLFEVDATGGAFLLVKREVFEKLSKRAEAQNQDEFYCGQRNSPDSWWEKRDGLSEDFSFCTRAKEAGFKVIVDVGVDVGHIAEVVITKYTARKLRSVEWAKWQEITKAVPGSPVASIVIPTFNQRPKYLLAAVHSALSQTVPVEVIVVDDGSTMGKPLDVGESHPATWDPGQFVEMPAGVKVLTLVKNAGIAAALNLGVSLMSTDWFCWLSSDDLLDPEKVRIQLEAMLSSGAKASFHDYSVIGQGDTYSRYALSSGFSSFEDQHRSLLESCCINGSTVMIHRDLLSKEGFRKDLRYAQDWEMWLRISAQQHRWLHVPEMLGTRREGGNLTEAIAQSAVDDERRQRRDWEDAEVKRIYGVR